MDMLEKEQVRSLSLPRVELPLPRWEYENMESAAQSENNNVTIIYISCVTITLPLSPWRAGSALSLCAVACVYCYNIVNNSRNADIQSIAKCAQLASLVSRWSLTVSCILLRAGIWSPIWVAPMECCWCLFCRVSGGACESRAWYPGGGGPPMGGEDVLFVSRCVKPLSHHGVLVWRWDNATIPWPTSHSPPLPPSPP